MFPRNLSLLLACALVCLAAPANRPPSLMFYAWYDQKPPIERAPGSGVAFLLAEILLGPDDIQVSPRRQPLRVPPGTFLMPVLRISFEDEPSKRPRWTSGQREKLVAVTREALELTKSRALQLDFDAPVSGRAFYRSLLQDARRALGPDVFLSMTALLSWCGNDSWLKGLPVDEIVPLTFRHAGGGPPFPCESCRNSIGIDGRPAHPRIANGQRVYIFADFRGWGDIERIQAEMK